MAGTSPLGLIAGAGRLPHAVAAGARRRGRRVAAIALEGITDAGIAVLAPGDLLAQLGSEETPK